MSSAAQPMPRPEEAIRHRIDNVPQLASLRSISNALSNLLNTEYSFTAQIAEIISRDPSLTSRLLKLVNSVFFGISHKITNIEEAVFYLGLRQIKELALATPVIEDFEQIQRSVKGIEWRKLWQHSIGSALLTREILAVADITYEDDTDYLIGLLHKVGKIVMAAAFPDEFVQIHQQTWTSPREVAEEERRLIGWDHAQMGAYYLQKNRLKAEIFEGIAHQFSPTRAGRYALTAAAIQLADQMLVQEGIFGIENIEPVEKEEEDDEPMELHEQPGWMLLFGGKRQQANLAMASLTRTLKRLPMTLEGMV
ncbi:MAG: signal transduction protein [Puniceicoccaceae bacterium 5H]|nr:MAG: signal transduction protein [Puniceicoccaceae bacterium 5H]